VKLKGVGGGEGPIGLVVKGRTDHRIVCGPHALRLPRPPSVGDSLARLDPAPGSAPFQSSHGGGVRVGGPLDEDMLENVPHGRV
jgi:hypothetical protein